MKCPKCQFDNPEVASFCVECGEKLENKRPKCGFNNEPSFKFCAKCGRDLKAPKEVPFVDYSEPQSYT